MSAITPTIQQTSRTFDAFYSASNPATPSIDTEVLSKLLSPNIVVEYRGFDSGKWNKIEGREKVVAIIQEVFTENFALLKKETSFEPGKVDMTTESKMSDGLLKTDETYTLQIEDGNCVIARVIAHQEKRSNA